MNLNMIYIQTRLLSSISRSSIRILDCQYRITSPDKSIKELIRTDSTHTKAWLSMLEGLAHRALKAQPTLEYIKLAVFCVWERITWLQIYWRVFLVDNQRVLQQVALDDYEAIYSIDRMFIPPEALKPGRLLR